MKNKLATKFLWIIMLVLVFILSSSAINSQTPNNTQEQKRDIIRRLEEDSPKKIAKARPKVSRPKSASSKTIKQSEYTLVGSTADKDIKQDDGVDVGFTFWVLKEANNIDKSDNAEVIEVARRKTRIKEGKEIKEKIEKVQLIPKRTLSDNNFANGDIFRFSLDLPVDGYVYIFNREKYSDGTLGAPYLIFPRIKDKNISDKTIPGKLLFIPNLVDYFEIEETSENKEKVAEVYYVLVSPNPVPDIALLKTNEPELVDLATFSKYEKFNAPLLKFECKNQENTPITQIEKLASIGNSEVLGETDPLPQTVYHILKPTGEPIFFAISVKTAPLSQ
jgi:hypothetical protein